MSARPVRGLRVSTALTNDPVFDGALEAFMRSDVDTCKTLLRLGDPRTSEDRARYDILLARVARSEKDSATWHDAATSALSRKNIAPETHAMALALRAASLRQMGRDAEADEDYRVLDALLATLDAAALVEAHYIVALDAWQMRDYDRSEGLTKEMLKTSPAFPEAVALLGWIAVKREKYSGAIRHFRKALELIVSEEPVQERHRAIIVQQTLGIAIECVDLASCRRMRAEFANVNWTKNTQQLRFSALMNLRYAALLEGDLSAAWFYARDATLVAPAGAYAALAEVLLAVVTRLMGDEHTSEMQFRRAWDAIRTHKWSEADAQARVALSYFASEAASTHPVEARKALMLYRSISEKYPVYESLTFDRRIDASELWAAGRVAEAMGDRSEAIDLYKRSLATWTDLDCFMRAAGVALDLLRMTRDPVYREPIATLATRAPKAWIVTAAERLDGPLGTLGPIQRRILALILSGEGSKAIAKELERSEYTVINHTRTIFAAFEVHSRPQLRTVCFEQGITAESVRAYA